MSETRGIIWDFDGTLAERPGLWSGCLLELLDEEDPGHSIRKDDISPFLRSGFPWHTPERSHLDLCSPDAWWDEITRLLTGACEGLGYTHDRAFRVASRVRERYVNGAVGWRVFPETSEALSRFHEQGWTQVVLSNHAPELPNLVSDLGLAKYFDAVITSAAIGYEKPHPNAYAIAMEQLGESSDTWMVGDSVEADYHGPQRNGIRAALLWRRTTPCPENVARNAPDLTSVVELILTEKQNAE